MSKSRLEAFSDGVLAIIITIMVLELHVPEGASWKSLGPVIPVLLSYTLSFIFIGIYWNNHHHLFHLVHKVNGRIMWANLHLLFWLSLTPFVMGWMGRQFEPIPVAMYGVVQFFSGIAFTILVQALIAHHGKDWELARALGSDWKGKISGLVYFIAIPLAFYYPTAACAIYVGVALMWIVPDRRVERVASEHKSI
jgi:uncharacterized membrane protein